MTKEEQKLFSRTPRSRQPGTQAEIHTSIMKPAKAKILCKEMKKLLKQLRMTTVKLTIYTNGN